MAHTTRDMGGSPFGLTKSKGVSTVRGSASPSDPSTNPEACFTVVSDLSPQDAVGKEAKLEPRTTLADLFGPSATPHFRLR